MYLKIQIFHKFVPSSFLYLIFSGVGVAVLNDLLYAVGGHDGTSYLNSIERYDPQTNQWSAEVAPTSSCRTSVGVAVLDGFLYAVGGQDGVSCLNHVERYVVGVIRKKNILYFNIDYKCDL